MYYVYLLTLLVIGVVAASAFIDNKAPQAKPMTAFLKPHEGYIGLVSIILGLFWTFKMIFNLGSMLKYVPMLTIIWLISAAVMIILGLLMGQNLLRSFSGSNKNVTDAINKSVDKFAGMKEKLGLAALVLAVLNLILRLT